MQGHLQPLASQNANASKVDCVPKLFEMVPRLVRHATDVQIDATLTTALQGHALACRVAGLAGASAPVISLVSHSSECISPVDSFFPKCLTLSTMQGRAWENAVPSQWINASLVDGHSQTSRTLICWPPGVPAVPLAGAEPLKFKLPILLTIAPPTASTAPRGLARDGACAAVSCTRNSLMNVLFQTPAVPLTTSISLVKMKPQRSDSYQPRDNGDHSKRCTRIGVGSIVDKEADWIAPNMAGVSSAEMVSIWGGSSESMVSMV